jgi:ADP-ribose pyrophosphatase YjhB (NUDIX family)
MKKSWLSPEDWKLIKSSIPVVCIDALPVRFSSNPRHDLRAVGLILRETPQGRKWCLIGGRLMHGESLSEALHRQVAEALGRHIKLFIGTDQQPLYIAQYSPARRRPFALDPRQHSVGLTYAVEMDGIPDLGGEAIQFEWFKIANVRRARQFGFGQDSVIKTCLRLLKNCPTMRLSKREDISNLRTS